MSILIKNATIIYPGNALHNSKKDILIKNGQIEKIASRITASASKVIESKKLCVSPGWLDIGATSGEPGYEHRESLETLSETAASGGYTALAIFPNTNPVIDNRSSVQYILNSTANHLVDHYPIAAISKDCKGTEITEMIDMNRHGAIAFSDGLHSLGSSGLMMRALDYVKSIDGLIIHHPQDATLANDNQIHEGQVSTELGLKGNPNISELITLERDIQLTKYTSSKLLAYNVSTKESVGKLKGLNKEGISASVSYLNLCKTDAALYEFNSNMKTIPPLRGEEDKAALIAGVKASTIQVISSNHHPLEEEAKKKEYTYADAGATGLQTCYSGLATFAGEISDDKIVRCLAINPRKVLGLPQVNMEVGSKAELTLFDPQQEWTLDAKTNTSKSKNSPFWNQNLKGKVIGVVNGKKSHFNNY